ncbi:MAG: fibronectin type III domain-containing protein, partial [Limisphaerales bacterium]
MKKPGAGFGSGWALGNGVIALTLLLAGWALCARADSTFVYAVQVSAVVQVSPPQITLNWEADPYGANNYTIYRKAKDDTDWGSPLVTVPGYVTTYADAAVSVGSAYEYQIVKAATLGYYGFGYIYSGINVPPTENRGTVLLVVATNSTTGLDFELSRLHDDLVGDGWQVQRFDVSSNDTPDAVHSLILGAYWQNPSNVNTLFLLGHVPILQSGYLDYDGHGPRPMPADAYYGDVSYDWPTEPSSSPSYIPSDITLMVGRVDMANMPGNGAPAPWPSETELLRNYLNKEHNWRLGLTTVPRLALMGNRRGDEGGLATAASGYRNFEPLVGPGNTVEANISDTAPADQRWMSMLAGGSYLWAYGCGAGQDTGIGYLGTHLSDDEVWSTDIVGQDAKAVFVMLFGSHFGNWDHPDNIMRAVLATPDTGLACCMSGEPHWFCHHMGLGETIGYSTRLTINNSTLYQSQMNTYTRAVYIALMGDPTLRMEPIRAPEDLTLSTDYAGVHLSWTPSQQSVAGYFVYRSGSPEGPFARLTDTLVT